MQVFRVLLVTDVALSGVAIVIPTIGVTVITGCLKKIVCESTVVVLFI